MSLVCGLVKEDDLPDSCMIYDLHIAQDILSEMGHNVRPLSAHARSMCAAYLNQSLDPLLDVDWDGHETRSELSGSFVY